MAPPSSTSTGIKDHRNALDDPPGRSFWRCTLTAANGMGVLRDETIYTDAKKAALDAFHDQLGSDIDPKWIRYQQIFDDVPYK